ncbi:MAG: mobile mystery protein B [Candidatus Acidiferrales bacterium]
MNRGPEAPNANQDDANTPLTPEELAGLIPDLSTRQELNEWEGQNILRGREWALGSRLSRTDPFEEGCLRELHRRMLGDTWSWAGKYRTTNKNLGVPFYQIHDEIGRLLGDVRFWVENKTYGVDEVAVRFHHRLTQIHPFPNGNGRHARLMADMTVFRLGRPLFSWGPRNLVRAGSTRTAYINALRAADNGDIQPLLKFARQADI